MAAARTLIKSVEAGAAMTRAVPSGDAAKLYRGGEPATRRARDRNMPRATWCLRGHVR